MAECRYPLEELLPLVETLAQGVMGYDHSSITYDKAQQLLGAVMYCIQAFQRQQETALSVGKVPAKTAYRQGLKHLTDCRDAVRSLYETMLPSFSDFGIVTLREVFFDEIPDFLRSYDTAFAPQNAELAFFYPVLAPLPECGSVEAAVVYLSCLQTEQRFLCALQPQYADWILRHRKRLEAENLCEAVLLQMTGYIIARKPPFSPLHTEDFTRIQQCISEKTEAELHAMLEAMIREIATHCLADDSTAEDYLLHAVTPLRTRMRLLNEYGNTRLMVLP